MGCVGFGCMILNITLFTWLTDPIKDIRYLRQPTPLTEKPLLTKIWYSLCIIHNTRLIGTNAQVANIPPPFKGTRSQFLWRRLQQLLISLALLDMIAYFIHSYQYFYKPGSAAPAHLYSGALGYLIRTGCSGIWLVRLYLLLKLSYTVMSMVAVATRFGHGNPEDWPEYFGSWSEAYTVRRLWGRAWHQALRRHFSHWGKFVVQLLGVPRGTWLSSQVQVHVAFALSSLLHCMGDLMLGKEHFGRSSLFFAANGLAVTAEDTVIALAKRFGLGRVGGSGRPSRVMRILGYIWVYFWFTSSGPLYYSWLFESGMASTDVMRYSPTRTLIMPLIRHMSGTQ
ncbi:hypothetical protein BN946_scf184996.g20 [Trametes cinnabarina]|uniref:Wax synthase domain-containing protein n=1 Tax=Pycnoporus cinnabarinus TaxID=5643 RepID=A0A060S8I0_PYCCI|nr:hypothetical protein BN946_scf184996.g20 [Trametes cinnabarina]